jgi:hypothetical protein
MQIGKDKQPASSEIATGTRNRHVDLSPWGETSRGLILEAGIEFVFPG